MDLVSKRILEVFTIPFDSERETFEKVVFNLSGLYLSFEADENNDELKLQVLDNYENLENLSVPTWADDIIGKQIIGFWIAKNQNGYFDLFALGLDEFVPNLIISCIASQIEVGIVNY